MVSCPAYSTCRCCRIDADACRKVVIVLEELGLDYDSKYLVFDKGEQKSPEYTKYNPNGRIPTLIDHKNNDFVIW